MAEYQPNVICQYADKLNSRANSIVVLWGILGAIGGMIVGMVLLRLPTAGAFLVGGLGAAIGASIGSSMAFSLRLKAQMALCQVQIEENTRTLLEQDRPAAVAPNKHQPDGLSETPYIEDETVRNFVEMEGDWQAICNACGRTGKARDLYHETVEDVYYHGTCLPE